MRTLAGVVCLHEARHGLVERNIYLGVAAGGYSSNGDGYAAKMLSQNAPCGIADNDNGDAAAL